MLARTITTVGVVFTCAIVSFLYTPKEFVDIVNNSVQRPDLASNLDGSRSIDERSRIDIYQNTQLPDNLKDSYSSSNEGSKLAVNLT